MRQECPSSKLFMSSTSYSSSLSPFCLLFLFIFFWLSSLYSCVCLLSNFPLFNFLSPSSPHPFFFFTYSLPLSSLLVYMYFFQLSSLYSSVLFLSSFYLSNPPYFLFVFLFLLLHYLCLLFSFLFFDCLLYIRILALFLLSSFNLPHPPYSPLLIFFNSLSLSSYLYIFSVLFFIFFLLIFTSFSFFFLTYFFYSFILVFIIFLLGWVLLWEVKARLFVCAFISLFTPLVWLSWLPFLQALIRSSLAFVYLRFLSFYFRYFKCEVLKGE